jgi:hypothetical protein
VGRFLCSRPSAAVPPNPISCVSGPLPIPMPPSLTDGARLLVLSSPKSPSSARQRGNAGQIAGDGPTTCHHPSVARMPMCAPAALSHRISYGAPWRPVTDARLLLLHAALPPVKFWPWPMPRCSIQASVSCCRIASPATSPTNH